MLTPLSTCNELKTPANDSERTSSRWKTKSSYHPQENPGLVTKILKHQRGKLLVKAFFFCISDFVCPSLAGSSLLRADCRPLIPSRHSAHPRLENPAGRDPSISGAWTHSLCHQCSRKSCQLLPKPATKGFMEVEMPHGALTARCSRMPRQSSCGRYLCGKIPFLVGRSLCVHPSPQLSQIHYTRTQSSFILPQIHP